MADSRSDGLMAVELLDGWLRHMLADGHGQQIVAKDLVFRDLYVVVARHPGTAARLVDLHRQIGEAGSSAADVRRELQAAIDTTAGEDVDFGESLADLVHVLGRQAPETPGDVAPPEPVRTVAFDEPGLVDRILNSLRRLDSGPAAEVDSIPVSIHLSDSYGCEQVEAAVVELLASVGVEIVGRDNPVLDSWFRRLWARHADSEVATAMNTGRDAANMMHNLGPVISSVQPYEEVVIRAGALLVVKIGPRLTVQQLTPAQQFRLDHQPELAYSPELVLSTLTPRWWEPAGRPRPPEDWFA